MGTVLAAVYPAVIVPSMIHIIEEKYGQKRKVPQLILAGASMDDIFVIVLFSSFLSLALGNQVSAASFLEIPVAIIMGILGGFLTGWLAQKFYRNFHISDSSKIIMLLIFLFYS